MPGFFDLFFRSEPEPEPEAPKPKKVKKAQKPKEDTSLVDSLRADIAELREMVTTPEPEPEPEVDESKRDPRGYEIIVKEDSDGEDESD